VNSMHAEHMTCQRFIHSTHFPWLLSSTKQDSSFTVHRT
jgi:hypothetical protein